MFFDCGANQDTNTDTQKHRMVLGPTLELNPGLFCSEVTVLSTNSEKSQFLQSHCWKMPDEAELFKQLQLCSSHCVNLKNTQEISFQGMYCVIIL